MADIVPPPLSKVWNQPSWGAEFWARVVIDTTSCWTWTGPRSRVGYGTFSRASDWGTTRAHRLSYMWAVGPIPGLKVLDHLCRNRSCVNPGHLEPVTNRENILRGMAERVVREVCDQGHPLAEPNLVESMLAQGKRRCLLCHNEDQRIRYYSEPSLSPDAAECGACGRVRHVRVDGMMHKHRRPDRSVCPGSGNAPRVVAA